MTIIVTGGAGFIGNDFIFHMLRAHSARSDRLLGQAHLRRQSDDDRAGDGGGEFSAS